jgi:hypothetical protein
VVQLVSFNLFIFQALLNSYGFVTGKGKTLERVPEVSVCVQRSFFLQPHSNEISQAMSMQAPLYTRFKIFFVVRFSAHLAAIIFGAV